MSNKENNKNLSPRELRLNIAAERNTKEKSQKESDVRKEFHKYFSKLKKKINLDSSLEDVLWLHLKSTGNNKPESFDKGVQHFGYDI